MKNQLISVLAIGSLVSGLLLLQPVRHVFRDVYSIRGPEQLKKQIMLDAKFKQKLRELMEPPTVFDDHAHQEILRQQAAANEEAFKANKELDQLKKEQLKLQNQLKRRNRQIIVVDEDDVEFEIWETRREIQRQTAKAHWQ